MLADMGADMGDGVLTVVEIDMIKLIVIGERISRMRTFAGGHRGFDTVRVAPAIDLGANDFLSFDANQNELAAVLGLKTPFGGAWDNKPLCRVTHWPAATAGIAEVKHPGFAGELEI